MARTVSVFDDESRVSAAVTVVESDGAQRITELRFTAVDGHSITSDDLRMITFFGLQLPTANSSLTPAAPPALPVQRTPKRRAAAAKPARKKAAPAAAKAEPPAAKRKRYFSGPTPSDEQLLKLWGEHKMVKNIAASLGASTSTVQNWMKAARERGVTFPGHPVDEAAAK